MEQMNAPSEKGEPITVESNRILEHASDLEIVVFLQLEGAKEGTL